MLIPIPVFQYTYEVPGEGTQWTVMWDYNIGLVRTTHLFKCNEYSKASPFKFTANSVYFLIVRR